MKNSIVFVVAHPDDEMISCGALLLSAVNSEDYDVYCVLVSDSYTDSVLSNYRYNTFSFIMNELNIKYLNLGYTAYSFSHSDLPNIYEELKNILGFDYKNYEDSYIVTHHPNDFNKDHSEVSKSVILSFRNVPVSIFYMDSYSTEQIDSFRTNYQFYFNKDVFEKKIYYINLYSAMNNLNSIIYDKNRIASFDLFNRFIICPDKPYSEKFEVYRLI